MLRFFAKETGRSPRLRDFPEDLLPDHKNVDQGRAERMFRDRFRVQLPDEESTTVTSHISKVGPHDILQNVSRQLEDGA